MTQSGHCRLAERCLLEDEATSSALTNLVRDGAPEQGRSIATPQIGSDDYL
jgi:hypothetical protein